MSRQIAAAGVLPYRVRNGAVQVALVHRPRYDDWSWPKGKLERGEDWAAAAVRETAEETGLQVRLGMPLPDSRYTLRGGNDKLVRYWAGTVVDDEGALEHEVDEVAWLSPTLAARRLTYERDKDQLAALVALHRSAALDTWPLLVVRHAQALDRGRWKQDDRLRPLTAVGRRRAQRMVPVLDAYAPVTVLSSPSTRCVQTLDPWAEDGRATAPVRTKKGLSEEGFEADPSKLDKHLRRLLAAGEPAALCTHGPLLPTVVEELWARSASALDPARRRLLARLVDVPLDKGEVLACTLRGTGDDARVVAVERHRPPASSR